MTTLKSNVSHWLESLKPCPGYKVTVRGLRSFRPQDQDLENLKVSGMSGQPVAADIGVLRSLEVSVSVDVSGCVWGRRVGAQHRSRLLCGVVEKPLRELMMLYV